MQKGTNLHKLIPIIIDVVGIFISIYLTLELRVYLNPIFSVQLSYGSARDLLLPPAIIVAIWVILFYQTGRYELTVNTSISYLLIKILKNVSMVIIILMIVSFLSRSEVYSRSLIMILWIVSIIVLTPINILSLRALHWFRGFKVGVENIAVVGYSNHALDLVLRIKNVRRVTYEVCGHIIPREYEINKEENVQHDNIIGTIDEVPLIINKYSLDRIIVCGISISKEDTLILARTCEKMGVYLNMTPDIINFISNRITLTDLGDIPLMEIRIPGFTSWEFVMKRAFDILTISVIGVMLFPLMCLISILIKLDSSGPVFFVQKRLGKGGKYFFMHKFRSMFEDADKLREELEELNEADGYLFKIKKDERITKVGKILRKFSLDELPQIINVLKGQMSLVGPRPLPTSDFERMSNESEYNYWFEERCKVLPGITGLWQVNGRSNTQFDELVSYDIYYLENWSLWLDFQILLKTIPIVLSSRGAY